MKLLDKLSAAGYKVQDMKRTNGARIIVITGNGAWVRCVFRAGCTLTTAKLNLLFLHQSARNLLAR